MEYNSYKSHKLNAIIERSEDQDLSKLISLFENNYASPQCREVSWILDQPNLDEIQEGTYTFRILICNLFIENVINILSFL